jgi:putative ABC transport system permease protein
MPSVETPQLAVRVVTWLVPERYREQILDDLAEVWPGEVARRGLRGARRWYWREVVVALLASWWQVLRFGGALRPASENGDGRLFTLLYDWRQVIRGLRRAPGFTAVTVLTLALGIGSTTAILSLVNTVLLQPLPFREPDRLVQIETIRGGERGEISLREIDDLRERFTAAEDVAVYVPGAQYSVTEAAAPEKASAILASHNLFAVLGVPLLYGEPFPASYDRERHNAIVLSHGLWQRQFGSDPAIVGRSLTIDATPGVATPPYVVAGVMPEGFDFPARTDLYRSLFISASFPNLARRDARSGIGIARLEPAVSVKQAQEELAAISRQLAREFPATNEAVTLTLTPLGDVYVGPVRPYLVLLLAAVATLLVIACVNVANLFLSRALDRQAELSVRRALGAGRGRIMRQLVLEGGTLAFVGGALGVVLAHAFLVVLGRLVKLDLPAWMTVELDRRVLLFTLGLSAVGGLVATVLPALRATTTPDADALRSAGSRAIGSARQGRLRRVLLVGEIAVSALLLVGAGLMLQTFRALWQTNVGFTPGGLLTFRVGLPVYYSPERTRQFQDELTTRLGALPGVRGAAVNSNLPLARVAQSDRQTLVVEGQDVSSSAANPYVNYQRVSSGYFDVMGVPILHGRAFDKRHREGAQPVAIVNRRLADRFWPGQDPIGKRLRQPRPNASWLVVVGVAGDVRHESLTASEGFDVYLPAAQSPQTWSHVVVRVAQDDPMLLADAARRAVWAINPQQPVAEMQAMRERMLDTAWQQRASAFLLGVFACLALALATVGIYGVTAYTVGQRMREFGVRRALGAQRIDLALVVLREVGRTAALGLAAGLGLALLAARAVRPLLYGVAPLDALTFTGVALLLLTVALAASLGPASRAARTDPVITLRND